LDDLSGGRPENLASLQSVEFVNGSILDAALVRRCADGARFVCHQAALGSVPASMDRPRVYVDVNVTGTLNVLEAARDAGVRRLMFAASSSAYGDSEVLPKIETMPPLPRSPYAATKVAGEALMAAYAAGYGLDTVSLRYFNIFGPRQSATSAYAAVIAAFAKNILANQRPAIFGDGEQSRDFTYVANVVHANLLAARSQSPLAGAVINIACGQRVTVNELAKKMSELLEKSDLTPIYHPDRAGDVKHSLADLTRAKRLLNYAPLVNFAEGISATVKWYQFAE